ncbi:hypothetical protein L208DRAFT_1465797 [Tricholoma matsutake]|nr:hypothetical protein L208DRAFT_1465797 [Tricholoma matsutake 945]
MPRDLRSHNLGPLPSELGFYEGHWIHILNSAKALYRYMIHTDIPFLERNIKNLKIAQECILEAFSNYMDENEDAELDKYVYEANKVGMTMLVTEETTYQHMKTIGRDIVQIFYKDDIYPQLDFNHNSNQLDEVVADNIKKLLKDSHFHGCTNNFSHPAIIDLCKRFYYSGKYDCLNGLESGGLPENCLTMALTCLVHCLHESQMGSHVKLSFKGQEYDAVHQEFMDIIQMTMKHQYHGLKLRKLLRKIIWEGW